MLVGIIIVIMIVVESNNDDNKNTKAVHLPKELHARTGLRRPMAMHEGWTTATGLDAKDTAVMEALKP